MRSLVFQIFTVLFTAASATSCVSPALSGASPQLPAWEPPPHYDSPNYGSPNHGGYSRDNWNVFYRGYKVEGASASSFTELGGGYGKDNWTVFYRGHKIESASASSFTELGGGYGKDTWRVYYLGEELKGASPSSFRIPRKGR